MSRWPAPIVRYASLALAAPCIAAAVAGSAPAVDVLVTPLGGEPVQGVLAECTPEGLTIEAGGELRQISADQLPVVRPVAATASMLSTLAGRVWLTCGSSLPIAGVRTLDEDGGVELVLAGDEAQAGRTLVIPIDAVHAIRFPGRRPKDPEAWEALRRRTPMDDLVVAVGEDGATLDYVEGFIEAIGDETLTVILDNEPIDAPRRKVFGVVFANEPITSAAEGPEVVLAGGARLHAAEVSLVDDQVLVTTQSGVEVTARLASLAAIDYTLGRLTDLGDLTPVDVQLRPLLGMPAAIADGPGWPALRLNRGYWGGPLRLLGDEGEVSSFDRGLALRSGAELSFAVAGYKRLQGLVGVAASIPIGRAVRLRIDAAGEVLLDRTLTAGEPAARIDLDLSGAASIRVRVDRQAGPDSVLNLCQARLVR